jgi:hypothetical protein
MNEDKDEHCPCGSGKNYHQCCKKEFDQVNTLNSTKDKLKDALSHPDTKKELEALLNKIKQEK